MKIFKTYIIKTSIQIQDQRNLGNADTFRSTCCRTNADLKLLNIKCSLIFLILFS
uniref:Uncharacterized protein n=1 Tax=Octopus bimaculoides TaxID=37653 RepID=A0A0L8FS35_OCTBM